ncbi:hypothetical protein BaRGS_00006655 [Batillaria attramentaria]|uniref:Uncharacterized protein n=1 Tax=Batillaria attramentaria TaxID=370345 RepID=A0ABD0LS69_9CAEN
MGLLLFFFTSAHWPPLPDFASLARRLRCARSNKKDSSCKFAEEKCVSLCKPIFKSDTITAANVVKGFAELKWTRLFTVFRACDGTALLKQLFADDVIGSIYNSRENGMPHFS